MIPANDAIIADIVASAIVALIISLARIKYWRAKVHLSYQDGHTAGIATQIGRQHRAEAQYAADRTEILHHQCEILAPEIHALHCRDDRCVLGCDCPCHAGWIPASNITEFPDGLPDGLREYAAQAMAATDAQKWSLIP